MRALSATLLTLLASIALAADKPMPMEEAFEFTAHRSGDDVVLDWQIRDGFYLYREYLTVIGSGGVDLRVETPQGIIKEDKSFGSTEVYYRKASARVFGASSGILEVTYQGCQEDYLCYPPTTVTVNVGELKSSIVDLF